jgi:hypothetical protein
MPALTTASRRLAGALAALLAAAALAAAPAQAAPGFDPSDGTVTPSLPRSTPVGHGCRVYGSSNGFGAYCNAVDGRGRTVEEILAAAGIPECWNERPSEVLADDYAAMRQQRLLAGEQGDYWVRVCVRFPQPNNPVFDTGPEWIPLGQQPVILTPAQLNLIAVYNRRELPAPTVHVSPVSQPRVFQPVAFSLDPVLPTAADPNPYEVTVRRGNVEVTVQARLYGVEFSPADGVTLACPGWGVLVGAADTPRTRPEACWWTFPHSSAAQVDQVYRVHATAYWEIWYEVAGTWSQIGVYPKELGDLSVRVTEVQTVVVP